MRTCVWCGEPLPEQQYKGHRRREFCPAPKSCKQQHYLWHKKMRHDANMLVEPYWKAAYGVLVEQYKLLELRLQDRLNDLEEEHRRTDRAEESMRYYQQRYDDLIVDFLARLRALGMS